MTGPENGGGCTCECHKRKAQTMLDLNFTDKRKAVYKDAGDGAITLALIGVGLALICIALFSNSLAVKAGALAWATLP